MPSILNIEIPLPPLDVQERIVVYDEYGRTRMIRDRQYKYIHRYGDGECELYDMEKDPDETKNIVHDPEYAEIVESLRREMEEWFSRYTDEKNDARKFDVKGRGQQKLCWQKDAFNTEIEFYSKR